MKLHEFMLVLTERPSEANAESLYGICQDGTLTARAKAGHIQFHRTADSLEEALDSALADVCAAGMSVERVEAGGVIFFDPLENLMAVHEVDITLPKRELGRADAIFEVKADGVTLGALHIPRGAVVWFPAGTTYGYKVKWSKFDELMQENGSRNEAR